MAPPRSTSGPNGSQRAHRNRKFARRTSNDQPRVSPAWPTSRSERATMGVCHHPNAHERGPRRVVWSRRGASLKFGDNSIPAGFCIRYGYRKSLRHAVPLRPLAVPRRREHHTRPTGYVRGHVGPTGLGGRYGHRHFFRARLDSARQKRPASALFAVVVPIFFLKSDYSHTPAACGTPTMRTARGRVLFASCVRKKNTNNTSQRAHGCRTGCRTWRRRARKRWNCFRVRESFSTV